MWSLKMTTSNWEAFSRNHWFILHQDYKGFYFVYRILFWIQVHSRERLDNCRQTISCSSTLSKTERRNRWGNWNLWWILCSLREDILQDIKKEPINDTFFQESEENIENDWPEYKNQLCKSLQEYCKLKSELACVDGIVMKNERIVIPKSTTKNLQRWYPNVIHVGNFWIEKRRLVLELDRMNADIAEMISKCNTCTDFRN